MVLLIALIAGALVPVISKGVDNENLRKAAADFQIYVRTARARAIASGYPVGITLQAGNFTLHTLRSPPTADPADPSIGLTEEQPPEDETVQIKKPTTWVIRPWTEEKWRAPAEDRWIFQPSGLVPPLSVRFSRGDAYIECSFNTLTGEPEQEKYYFP